MPKNFGNTQDLVELESIQDDALIMKDGSFRQIIMVGGVNFSLKSEQEQNATVASYVQFLNSLKFPIQIVIQSRKLNIDHYLETLKQKEKEQTNELLKLQIGEYRNYIGELIELSEIMTKRFYVVVPLTPTADGQRKFMDRLQNLFIPASKVTLQRKRFLDRRQELSQRVELVLSGLYGMGLSAAVLNTQNLIELYYQSYNPETSEYQKVEDINQMDIEQTTATI